MDNTLLNGDDDEENDAVRSEGVSVFKREMSELTETYTYSGFSLII